MRKLLVLLALLFALPSFAATAFVKASAQYTTTSTCGGSGATITPTTGTDDLVFVYITFTSGATPNGSPTNSLGGTIITDHTFASIANNVGVGIVRVHAAGTSNQYFSAPFTGAVNCYSWMIEITGAGGFDTAVTNSATTSNAFAVPASATFTPSQNGALILAVGGDTTSNTWGTWTNSFTALAQFRSAGPTAYGAYLDQVTATAVNAGATISTSVNWAGIIFDYVPSGSGSCTHQGYTSGGALAIPNGTSGSYWGKSGAFVTPDCVTINYWQPTVGNFGLN